MSDTTKIEAAARTYRDQCLFFLDSIANQNGFIAELLEKIKALEEEASKPRPEVAELEELVKCKDEQIEAQSNCIVRLRAELETAKSECLG
jgi:phage shock protein A